MALSWKRALGFVALAMYGPFLTMAILASLLVACPHCKTASWAVLPYGPALLPLQVGRHLLGLGSPSGATGLVLAVAISWAMVLGLACLLRCGRRAWIPVVAAVAAVSSVLAFGTLAMIRA